jgi:TusA-related sulfurtransferase
MAAIEPEAALEATDAPSDRPRETLDVRSLGPPKPLSETLELLADLDDDVVLVQVNDRAPRHLYPKLADRGYVHDTVGRQDATVTAIWCEAATDPDD